MLVGCDAIESTPQSNHFLLGTGWGDGRAKPGSLARASFPASWATSKTNTVCSRGDVWGSHFLLLQILKVWQDSCSLRLLQQTS